MPKFSIIIPVYNVAPYLRECLDSVLAQTFTDWEAVCIDDGSTDGCGAILDEYAAQDNRIRVFHQRNAGVSAARNKALDVASGEWLSFVDGDDVIHPRWLEKTAAIIGEHNPDLIRFAHSTGVSPGIEFGNIPFVSAEKNYSAEDAKKWMWSTFPTSGFLCFNVIRRSVVKGRRFPESLNWREDCIWLLDVSLDINVVVESAFNGYFYRKTPGSLSKRRIECDYCIRFFNECIRVWKGIAECCKGMPDILPVLRSKFKASVDSCIIDWTMFPDKSNVRTGKEDVFLKYVSLKELGVIDDGCYGWYRYRVGCWLWERTGQNWLIYLPGMAMYKLRMLINAFKRICQ